MNLRNLYALLDKDFFKAAAYGLQILNWHKDHRFCSRCGSGLDNKPDERAKICGKCGFTVYPRISPAVIVAVTKGDKILLAKSAGFANSRMYSVIAGYAETGETLEECVRRELNEEVGIRVKNIRYFSSQPWPYSGSLMIGFTADYADGEICPDGEEITDAGWFSAENLPEIPAWGSIARKLIDHFTALQESDDEKTD